MLLSIVHVLSGQCPKFGALLLFNQEGLIKERMSTSSLNSLGYYIVMVCRSMCEAKSHRDSSIHNDENLFGLLLFVVCLHCSFLFLDRKKYLCQRNPGIANLLFQ